MSGERIETEALALIDKDGVHALTMRKLCNRLGFGKASMNLLFPSKGHILDALDDRVLRDIPIPDKSLARAQRLRAFARSWRVIAVRHPLFYRWLSQHQKNSPVGIRLHTEVLAFFYDAGLSPEHAALGFRVLGCYVRGAAIHESCCNAISPSSLNPLPPDLLGCEFPVVARSQQYSTPDPLDRAFEIGFCVLLRQLGLDVAPLAMAAITSEHQGACVWENSLDS
ncbi:MAG: TetR/AcrR family transcriptional regulator [Casimicrobium sp.]